MLASLASFTRELPTSTFRLARPDGDIELPLRAIPARDVDRLDGALGPWPTRQTDASAEQEADWRKNLSERATVQDAGYIALATGMRLEENGPTLTETFDAGADATRVFVERVREGITERLTGPEVRRLVAAIVALCEGENTAN